MPVDATPVDGASCVTQLPQYPGVASPRLLAVTCENRNVFTTQTSAEAGSGVPLIARIKSVRIPSNQRSVIQHVMHTEQGVPVDLSDCLCQADSSVSASVSSESAADCAYAVRFTMQETMAFETVCPIVNITASIVSETTGTVKVTLEPEQVNYPGVYIGQFSLVQVADAEDEPDITILSNMFYVVIGRNLTRLIGSANMSGPPTIPEVRLFLRDTSPEESYLLESVRFTDEEIAYAIQLPVMYWNEVPPPLSPAYTTANFPYRYHWLIAITGYLFMIAAEQNRANNLQYSAGGTAVNDQNKEMPYEAAADRRLTEWRAFVQAKKVSLNVALGFGNLGSGYAGYGGYW